MTEVRRARDPAEVQAALAVRWDVFVGEQSVPPADERDGRDDEAVHLVAVEDGAVVATCRLLEEGGTVRLGRLAVARTARRRGLGARLLEAAEAHARAAGARRVALAAQTDAAGLYERAGYVAYGERFMDAGIEHVMMEKPVA